MILSAVFFVLLAAALLRSCWEQRHFIVRDYELYDEKVPEDFRAVVIADLHGAKFGKQNEKLIRQIDLLSPDLVLIPGDLITCRRGAASAKSADLSLLRRLAARYHVYYAPGNHEENYLQLCPEFAGEVAGAGAVFLVNEVAEVDIPQHSGGRFTGDRTAGDRSGEDRTAGNSSAGDRTAGNSSAGDRTAGNCSVGSRICIAGLSIGEDYYVRGRQPVMPDGFVEEKLGPCPEKFTILLAHTPEYFEKYAEWGCGCVLSGHNHGGVIRLPLLGGVISARLRLFDRYDRGVFRKDGTTMFLSAGMGMHTIHVRLFNRPELLNISFHSARRRNPDAQVKD